MITNSVKKTNKKRGLKPVTIFKRNISGWLLLFPSIFLFFFIIWRPIVIGIGYSFFKLEGFTPVAFVGLDNFRDILSDTNFIKTLWNTVQYVAWSIIIGFPLPFICAVMMNEMMHGKGVFKVLSYLPVIIPSIAVCMIWTNVYMDGPNGLLNMILSYFGIGPLTWLSNKNVVIPAIIVSMTWQGFGSTLIVYLASLQSVNQELYEAARLDGAGFIGRFAHVTFPHMRGIMLLMVIRQIISVFSVTEQPLTMTGGGPNGASMSLGLTNYFYAFRYGQYAKSLALGVVTFCILIVLTFVYFGLDKRTEQ